MDALIKLVNDAHSATTGTALAAVSSGPQVKLVPLTAQDAIESYLVMFERIMEAYTISKEQRMYHLASQLTGKVQQVFAALALEESKLYEGIKAAVLFAIWCQRRGIQMTV